MQASSYLRAVLIGASVLLAACSDEEKKDVADAGDESSDATSEDESPAEGEGLGSLPDDVALPIVFAHGGAGSAQQYASQAMRFAANGYPQERIVAYDHDGAGFDVAQFIGPLDALIDQTLARFKAQKVYLVGHSRGTILSTNYLMDPARAAKIAKYISLDGGPCPEGGVPCISPNQSTLPGQKHVEVATSKECFVEQFKFLVGRDPKVVDIVAQSTPVEIAGRAVNFPQNTGREGATLEIYEVAPETGRRRGDAPLATFEIGASGDWGPAKISADKHYELVLFQKGTSRWQHFYPQRFLRSSYLERLLSGPPDSPARMNTNVGAGHAALTVLRMREWLPSDVLEVGLKRDSGGIEPRNIITESNVSKNTMVMGRSVGEPISIYAHDDAKTPGMTTLEKLPWFPDQFFQTGIDVYLPAKDPPDGTITVKNLPRGDASKAQTLNVPNWPSTDHVIMVQFSDFPQ